jgi:hypothetical protein
LFGLVIVKLHTQSVVEDFQDFRGVDFAVFPSDLDLVAFFEDCLIIGCFLDIVAGLLGSIGCGELVVFQWFFDVCDQVAVLPCSFLLFRS